MTVRRTLPLLAAAGLTVLAACSEPTGVDRPTEDADLAPLHLASANAVPGSYIVVLKDGANVSRAASQAGVAPRFSLGVSASGEDDASTSAAVDGDVAFVATLNAGELESLRRNPSVEFIEQDQYVHITGTQKMDSYGDPWGLDRIDQRSRDLSLNYSYGGTGAGVRVYVLDTGIDTDHSDFTGRAKVGYDALGGSGSDCNGHGTGAAGTIGAESYGVAKDATLYSVRVADCEGTGTVSAVLRAIEWVQRNHRAPAVANMSVLAGYSELLNDAVERLVQSGVFVSVAAGNENKDACSFSPQSAPSVFTTAASEMDDERASFSNYGKCVDGYAPGVKIWTTRRGGKGVYYTGTSIAAPHVAGVAAVYLGQNPDATPAQVDRWIKDNATTGAIKGNPSGTPNRLLFASPSSQQADDGSSTSSGAEPVSATHTGWLSRDVGAVAKAGSLSISDNGEFTIRGSGADIWDTSDEFRFVYQPLKNDGSIVARFTSQTNTDRWAKAGVMIRGSLAADAPHAMAVVTPDNGIAFQRRLRLGGWSIHDAGPNHSAPSWLCLVRRGNRIYAYSSKDGMKWTHLGTSEIAMEGTVYVGLIATSHNDGAITTATFDNVRVQE